MLNWIELTICIKMDLALNNLQKLICHKIQPTNCLQTNELYQIELLLLESNLWEYLSICKKINSNLEKN